jgi:hypothetical protein
MMATLEERKRKRRAGAEKAAAKRPKAGKVDRGALTPLERTAIMREAEKEGFSVGELTRLMGTFDPASVVRQGEADFVSGKIPPRAKGSEESYAFQSTDSKGRKTTRFTDKNKAKKGEKKKRFR